MKAQQIADRILIGTFAAYCGVALGMTLAAESNVRRKQQEQAARINNAPDDLTYRRTLPQVPEPVDAEPEPPLSRP